MPNQSKRIGMVVYAAGAAPESDCVGVLASIERAEELGGLHTVWSTSGRRQDAITLFAAAAVRTERIMLGTAIMQSFSRHPLVAAQQVQVLGQLAPGRFRLGVGPGPKETMESTFGAVYRAPLGHLREYIRILKAALQDGSVEFEGRYYKAKASFSRLLDVPIIGSALGARAFEVCGEEADGAMS